MVLEDKLKEPLQAWLEETLKQYSEEVETLALYVLALLERDDSNLKQVCESKLTEFIDPSNAFPFFPHLH